MSNHELPTRIKPNEYEKKIYDEWLEKNIFHADENSSKPPYSIVIPPPNVTGSLHMGHALNNTLQDILVRFYKLNGYETLWMPGTDHAGIATQNVVEKQLAEKNISRHEIGREKFIEKVWQWREESGGQIINQLKRLGASCDWERERFTMDEGLSRAVRKVFVTLYNEGLIYRSNYIINWCPRCHTALSDLEVEHEEKEGALYYINYDVKETGEKLLIATTRPETMLGDSGVAVNPDDERYSHLIGKTAILPIVGREMPIVGDEYVDMEFGTGALKITPAHDPNDFDIGRKHGLKEINMMDDSGYVNENGAVFEGMDRFEARKEIVAELEKQNRLVKKEKHIHSIGHCYRCKTVVEPRISMQWFVKIKPLADKAIEVVKNNEIKIVPENWEKTYYEWMYNIRDWCISRQIWWGHRIPAFYCEKCGHINVAMEDPSQCEKCSSTELSQETDVLDTWFSSALWPFSTMGWPEKTKTLEKFYPTSCLVTGFDILFFWVARMIMMGTKFMDDVPFREVYIHALVRDEDGQKMSKSKGNVIDPLTVIDEYGADAFRFTLAALAAQGRDIKLSKERVEGYRNFVNKIWNASRFILMNMPAGYNIGEPDFSKLEAEDKWAFHQLKITADSVSSNIKSYDFNEAAGEIYKFFWHTFCDWYLELIKDRIFDEDKRESALKAAFFVLKNSLIILHPFMPFVTEYIYKMTDKNANLLNMDFPGLDFAFDKENCEIETIISIISSVRNIRGEYNIPPKSMIKAYIKTDNEKIINAVKNNEKNIKKLSRLEELEFTDKEIEKSATNVSTGFIIYIPIEGIVDVAEEIARLQKDRKSVLKDYELYGKKLKNENYLKKAPREVIQKDTEKFEKSREILSKIDESIKRLEELC